MILCAQPAPALGPFVDCLWHMDRAVCGHSRERALPTGTVELVIRLSEGPIRIFSSDSDSTGLRLRRSVVCGPQSGYFVLDTTEQGPVLGVHFRQGGAAPFFDGPVSDFADTHLELEDLWGPRARSLRERLLEKASPAEMFALLEEALLARLRRPLLPHPAVAHALLEFGAAPSLARIAAVQSEAGYCPKRFIELFRNSVGLTPKLYCRIQRFQAVIDRLSRGRGVAWAEVALDGGYCDQSHLNREFRAFAGVTPSEYRPVANRPSHVAIED